MKKLVIFVFLKEHKKKNVVELLTFMRKT